MSDPQLWRYLSLAKYVDLLRTRSLYFPKASLFQDDTEGKWWGHAHLYESFEKRRQLPANIKTLEELLERAGQEPSAILREINGAIPSANEWVRSILLIALRAFPNKPGREFLDYTLSTWRRLNNSHNLSLEHWKTDMAILRESTYISCWNRAFSMSLAMWEMYGGGRESVAVQSTQDKLKAVINCNTSFLEQYTFAGAVADVDYIPGLKAPNEEVQERIYQIIFERDRDYRIGIFAINRASMSSSKKSAPLFIPNRIYSH